MIVIGKVKLIKRIAMASSYMLKSSTQNRLMENTAALYSSSAGVQYSSRRGRVGGRFASWLRDRREQLLTAMRRDDPTGTTDTIGGGCAHCSPSTESTNLNGNLSCNAINNASASSPAVDSMMNIDRFDVRLEQSTTTADYYLGGETIVGEIAMHVNKPTCVSRLTVKVFGEMHTEWTTTTSRSRPDVVCQSSEHILDEYLDLTRFLDECCIHGGVGSSTSMQLSEGDHSVSFKINLPLDVVSSMDTENFGRVRYTCLATLDLPDDGASEMIAERVFTVRSLLNVDAPYLRMPATSTESFTVYGCCRLRHGRLSAQLTVAEQGLLPGETTRITVTLENGSRKRHSKSGCALLSLCQQIDFVAQNRDEPQLFDRRSLTMAIASVGTCQAMPGTGPETKFIDFIIPTNIPPTSTKASGLITVSYFFKLDMTQFDVILPVVVGTMKTLGTLVDDCSQMNDCINNNHVQVNIINC